MRKRPKYGLPMEATKSAPRESQMRSVLVGFSRICDFQSQPQPTGFQPVVVEPHGSARSSRPHTFEKDFLPKRTVHALRRSLAQLTGGTQGTRASGPSAGGRAASLQLLYGYRGRDFIGESGAQFKSPPAIIGKMFPAAGSLLLLIKTILVDLRVVVELIGVEAKQ